MIHTLFPPALISDSKESCCSSLTIELKNQVGLKYTEAAKQLS